MTTLRTPRSAAGPGHRSGWTAARVACAVAGALLALCSLGLLGGGGTAVWASATQRHGGDIDLGTWSYRGNGYALASDTADMFGATSGWPGPRSLLGTTRIHVTSADGADPVFAGIAPADTARRYLAGVSYDTVRSLTHHHATYAAHSGGAPVAPPVRAGIWATRTAGPGTQTLTWPARPGTWTVVAMNADGSRPVAVRISVGAAMPALPWIGAGLLGGGVLVLAAGIALIVGPARRAANAPRRIPARSGATK